MSTSKSKATRACSPEPRRASVPRVFNRSTGTAPADAIYVGRPTKWGNPWTHTLSRDESVTYVETRAEAVEAFYDWILSNRPECVQLRRDARRALRGKRLVCWCAPDLCHAEIWVMIADSKDDAALGL